MSHMLDSCLNTIGPLMEHAIHVFFPFVFFVFEIPYDVLVILYSLSEQD